MARVRATQFRVVYQYRDEAGHRLPSEKGVWRAIPSIENLLLDCPKCPEPEPEPEPEPVECTSKWHQLPTESWWADSSINYCPQCGAALPAKQEE